MPPGGMGVYLEITWKKLRKLRGHLT